MMMPRDPSRFVWDEGDVEIVRPGDDVEEEDE